MVDIHIEDVVGLVSEGLVHRFWRVPPGNGWHMPGKDHYVIYPTLNCEWIDERIHLIVSNSERKSYFYCMSFGNRSPLFFDGKAVHADMSVDNHILVDTIKKALEFYHVKQTA